MGCLVPDTVIASVQEGSINLTGQVIWNFQRHAAEQAIRHLQGVISVSHSIALRSRGALPEQVKEQVQAALERSCTRVFLLPRPCRFAQGPAASLLRCRQRKLACRDHRARRHRRQSPSSPDGERVPEEWKIGDRRRALSASTFPCRPYRHRAFRPKHPSRASVARRSWPLS
jgi:hypothetical protein